jgi:hypothetical protein
MLKLTQKSNQEKTHKNKQFNPPCKLHNGSHEWDDCRQNPKNQKDDVKSKTENNRSRNGNGNGRS